MAPNQNCSSEERAFHDLQRPTVYSTFHTGKRYQRADCATRPVTRSNQFVSKEGTILQDRIQNWKKFEALRDSFTTSYRKSFVPYFGAASNYPRVPSSRETLEYWLPWEQDAVARQLADYDIMRRESVADESPVLLHGKFTPDPVASRRRRLHKRFAFCLDDDDDGECPDGEDDQAEATEPEGPGDCCPCAEVEGKTDESWEEYSPPSFQKKRRQRPTDADIRRLQLTAPTPIWLQGVLQNRSSAFDRERLYNYKKRRPRQVEHASPSSFDRSKLIAPGILPSSFPTVPIRIPHLAKLPKPYVHLGPLNSVPPTFWKQWAREGYEGPPNDEALLRWITV